MIHTIARHLVLFLGSVSISVHTRYAKWCGENTRNLFSGILLWGTSCLAKLSLKLWLLCYIMANFETLTTIHLWFKSRARQIVLILSIELLPKEFFPVCLSIITKIGQKCCISLIKNISVILLFHEHKFSKQWQF